MFSLRIGTVTEESKLGSLLWALAIYPLATSPKGISRMRLQRDLGITQKSARHLANRIHKSFEASYGPFVGLLEAGET